MAYTVKQVARMSGVSVRTLHFYDETGLLKPAYLRANGYRFIWTSGMQHALLELYRFHGLMLQPGLRLGALPEHGGDS